MADRQPWADSSYYDPETNMATQYPQAHRSRNALGTIMVLPLLAWRPGSGTARRPAPLALGPSARRHQRCGQQMAFIDE